MGPVLALAAIEVADAKRRPAPLDHVEDHGTGELFGAAMAGALLAAAYSLVRPGAEPLPRGRGRFRGGDALIWCGMAFNRWARLTLGRRHQPRVFVQQDHEIVASGPYRFVRHPMYLGSVLICWGIDIALGTPTTLLAWAIGPRAALVLRIRTEAAVLDQRLGSDYRSFAESRSRLVPYVW